MAKAASSEERTVYPVRAVFPDEIDPASGRPNRERSVKARRRDREVLNKWKQMAARGVVPWSVISVHLIERKIDMAQVSPVVIPAADRDTGYAQVVIVDPILYNVDRGNDQFPTEDIQPSEIAQEAVRQMGRTKGMLAYPGDRKPTSRELAELHESVMPWYREEYRIAVATWGQYPDQYNRISINARNAATVLLKRGEIRELPAWMEMVAKGDSALIECPSCASMIERRAKKCRFCQFEVDPEFWAAWRARVRSAEGAAGLPASGTPADPFPEAMAPEGIDADVAALPSEIVNRMAGEMAGLLGAEADVEVLGSSEESEEVRKIREQTRRARR